MAVSALVRLSEDKVMRQAYQKRQDEILLYNKRINDYKSIAEEAQRESQEKDAIIAQLKAQLAKK